MTILTVGSGQQFATLTAAVTASHDGDTIYVAAGVYKNDFAIVNTDISIIGVGGMAQFVATVSPPNGKAILITNADVTLDHLEFSGAKVAAKNGAGVKQQAGNLTVTNSFFHDNQDGMLVSPNAGGHLIIDHSEFAHNGAGDGFSHNIYVNKIDYFQATNSYFHNAVVGHEIKSRAIETVLTGNRIADGNSTASYSIDLPNGGDATIQNNVIQQGPNSKNGVIIRYGEENPSAWPGSALHIHDNTIVNQLTSTHATAVKNDSPIVANIVQNHFFGLAASDIAGGLNVQSGNDMLASLPAISTSHPWAASPWNVLVSGKAGADVLANTSANQLFVGGAGADTFMAGAGADAIADFSPAQGDKIDLHGIAGLTSLTAILGHSLQVGSDVVINLGGSNSLTLLDTNLSSLTAANFILSAVAGGGSAPAGAGSPPASGGDGSESLPGGSGNDTIAGGSGADTLSGGLGNDKLSGGWGNDSLSGDAGNDTLVGGQGADTLTGGVGADRFIFAGSGDSVPGSPDVITDFSHSQGDHIDVSQIDANTAATGNQAFTFIGTQAFHGKAGELHYVTNASGATVSGDTNGDGVADFSISVHGATTLAASDFIL